jgi:hypothetical protein
MVDGGTNRGYSDEQQDDVFVLPRVPTSSAFGVRRDEHRRKKRSSARRFRSLLRTDGLWFVLDLHIGYFKCFRISKA